MITIGIRNDLVDKCKFNFPQKHNRKLTIRDIKLDKNPSKEECMFYPQKKAEIFRLVPAGGYWRDIDEKIAKEYMKSSW